MFNQYFGSYLLEKKILKPEELRQVLAEQKAVKVKLGVLAIEAGLMNAAQVEQVHKLQAVKDRKFGELAIEAAYLNEDQLAMLLQAQKKSNVLLGQALIEKGLFSFEKYEDVLLQYRQDTGLSAAEIQALKNSDLEKIAEIFLKDLPEEDKALIRDYFELFLKNIVRFVTGDFRLEEAREITSYQYDYLVTQKIGDNFRLFSGFAATEAILAGFASLYTQEELTALDEMARDALVEFLNCHNGLFISHLSHQGIEADLYPGEVKVNGTVRSAGKLYRIPCHLSLGSIDFIFYKEVI